MGPKDGKAGAERTLAAALMAGLAAAGLAGAAEEGFRSDSKRFGNPRMDIVITEVERLPRMSVLDIEITRTGSSVGSSLFISCSVRELARQRGYRYIVRADDQPRRGQMLVGFLKSAREAPASLDARFANEGVFDLDQLSLICEGMK